MNRAKCQMTRREIYSPDNYFVDIEEEKNKAVERVRMAEQLTQRQTKPKQKQNIHSKEK